MATQETIAAHLDLSSRSVVDLLKKLDLPTRNCDLDLARVTYIRHLREKAAGRSGDGEYDLTEERARLAHHQANIAALDEKVKEKSLIPIEIVVSTWQSIAMNVRAKLLSMPPQIAAKCAGGSKDEIEAEAKELIYQALTELSEDVDY